MTSALDLNPKPALSATYIYIYIYIHTYIHTYLSIAISIYQSIYIYVYIKPEDPVSLDGEDERWRIGACSLSFSGFEFRA